ncbi:hypothetical protein OSB04_002556 [Centaurea solstitialis]|uniref:Glucose-methanol-choline oxidoreductase N-terminal domain-containing protein n=1 Tax=Centaurea solstitialis TaxID=347529 RepID=A0AA38U4X6_9ASTR|nr:hypothetical protein OSB04_002556 [Centaurea solstitialis]
MDFVSWRTVLYAKVTILFFQALCLAEIPQNYTFIHEATKAPKVSFYDYIVVGGGAAGIPIATTLSSNYSDGVVNVRAKVLGGGTTINAGVYSRGEKKFKHEARLMDEELINESYRWVEKVMVFKPVVGKWQSALRGALLEAGVAPDNGFSYDHSIGTKVTGTIFDQNGTRHTVADLLCYANSKRLSVLLHATVHKILFKTKGKLQPVAYGVVFEDSLGNKHRAYLKGGQKDEIILSAGSLGSPQLLMLSGIGTKEQLNAHRIKVVRQHPFVGQGMADNPLSTIYVPSPMPVEPSIVQVVGITPFGSYIEAVCGVNFMFASPSHDIGCTKFIKMNNLLTLLFVVLYMGGFIFEKINSPVSHGDLKLRNLDPSANPSVTFNYYKESKDLQKCVGGVKTILTVVESNAFSKFKYRNMMAKDILDLNAKLPTNLPTNANTSSSLEQFCKDTVKTLWRYHGGCQIGKVVDHEYKVLGVDALRVIDGSTILNSPGTNPQASILMLGRYMGLTIVGQRLARLLKPTITVAAVERTETTPYLPAYEVEKPYDMYSAEQRAQAAINKRALTLLTMALPNDMYARVESCKDARSMWLGIEQQLQGGEKAVERQRENAMNAYDGFCARDGETLTDSYNRLNSYVNDLRRLALEKNKYEVNVKFLKRLSSQRQAVTISIQVSQNLGKLELHDLYNMMLPHEETLFGKKEKKIHPLALAVVPLGGSNFCQSSSFQENYIVEEPIVLDDGLTEEEMYQLENSLSLMTKFRGNPQRFNKYRHGPHSRGGQSSQSGYQQRDKFKRNDQGRSRDNYHQRDSFGFTNRNQYNKGSYQNHDHGYNNNYQQRDYGYNNGYQQLQGCPKTLRIDLTPASSSGSDSAPPATTTPQAGPTTDNAESPDSDDDQPLDVGEFVYQTILLDEVIQFPHEKTTAEVEMIDPDTAPTDPTEMHLTEEAKKILH